MPPFCHIWKLIPQLDQPQPAFTNQTQTLVARVIRLLMSKIWHVVNWGHYSCPTRWCNFAWPWVSWQNFQGRGAWYGFSATAEILVNAKFHLAVRRGISPSAESKAFKWDRSCVPASYMMQMYDLLTKSFFSARSSIWINHSCHSRPIYFLYSFPEYCKSVICSL